MPDETEGFEPEPQPVDWERLNRLRGVGAVEPAEPETGSTSQGVTRYRKRPVIVETIRWAGTNLPAIRTFAGEGNVSCPAGGHLEVWNDQESAWIPCPLGHSVVKGRLGEFYPISPAAIAETYEPAGGDHITVSREDLRMAAAIADRMNVADSDGVHAQMTPPEMAVFDRLSAAAEVTR